MITSNILTPTCFLIDDDDDDNDFLLEALLKVNEAFTCLRARDGEEGVSMLSDGKISPRFILLDLNMPKMPGHQCLTELRKFPHLSAIPIYIYTTAHCSHMIIERMKIAGAQNVFMKPTRMRELIALIGKLIGQNPFTK